MEKSASNTTTHSMSFNCGILHNFVGFSWFLFLFPSYVPAHHHPQVYLECLELRKLSLLQGHTECFYRGHSSLSCCPGHLSIG